MRRAKVFYEDRLCGYLTEDEDGFAFEYTEDWFDNKKNPPVSLTMPLSQKRYLSTTLFPFFDGLLPEGWLLSLAIQKWNINRLDRVGLLLKVGKDVVGIIRVCEVEDD